MSLVDSIPLLPERDPSGHKGDYGHVLVLAGSRRMTGAALLVTDGALRGGAGLVTLGMPDRIYPILTPAVSCAMTLPLPSTPEGTFSTDAIQPVLDFCDRIDAVALGPGLTTNEETVDFATRVALRAGVPLVLDADGLNALALAPVPFRACTAPRVVTPHPGEAARLLGRRTEGIQADRGAAAMELAEKLGAVVALKGRNTVVTDGDRLYVNETGNPGMATGGSGDVLTGLIAALLAQKMEVMEATILGVAVHGIAGDLAAEDLGQISLTSDDLVAYLGPAFQSLTDI